MSTTAPPRAPVTPDELQAMPDGDRYELIDGELVERTVSLLSGIVASRINRLLGNHCEPAGLAWIAGSEVQYRCFPHKPGRVRKPDVSAILTERLPVEQLAEEGFVAIAPDLAVEVVSPNDLVYEIEERVDDYLKAGTPLVWVLVPPSRTVQVRRVDGSTALLGESDELTGEGILPGFRCRVGDLFPAVPGAAPAPTG